MQSIQFLVLVQLTAYHDIGSVCWEAPGLCLRVHIVSTDFNVVRGWAPDIVLVIIIMI